MFAKAIIVSALAALATAAPTTKRDSNIFTAITIHSGNINVHLRSVAAADNAFYIGRNSTANCPSTANVDCSTYANFTIFQFHPSATSGVSTLGLDVAVPDGQQVYVSPSGALAYTGPQGQPIQDGYVGPFEYTPQAENGSVGRLTFEGKDWWACPFGNPSENIYQLYAQGVTPEGGDRTACIDVAIATDTYSGEPAYEY